MASDSRRAAGSPVRIVTIQDANSAIGFHQDETVAGLRARAQLINETENGLGGSGRPVAIEVLETNMDAKRTIDLLRQVADDQDVLAIVGSLITTTTEGHPYLEQAGVPLLPSVACARDEYYAPNVFNVCGGHHAMAAGPILDAIDTGAKTVSTLSHVVAGSGWYGSVTELFRQRIGGVTVTEKVRVPLTGDVTPYVKLAGEAADAVLVAMGNPHREIEAIEARHKLGITTPYLIQGMGPTEKQLEDLGSVADGVLVQFIHPWSGFDAPGVQRYAAAVRAAGSGDLLGDKTAMGWTSLDLLQYATQGLGTLTRASVMEALNGVTDYTGGGMTPPLDFSKGHGPGAGYPRLFNWTYCSAKMVGGRLVGEGRLKPFPTDIPDTEAEFVNAESEPTDLAAV